MGRIRTKDIKDLSFSLHDAYPGRFSKDFESNKNAVNETKLLEGKSKRFRNRVAGYIVRVAELRARRRGEESKIRKVRKADAPADVKADATADVE
ncbi:MAG: 30S ribosomal protein S17e [Thaumarchaeota archaeon]|nr:30S ribosomal protein S17e [Nitrososphaerota archaeon]